MTRVNELFSILKFSVEKNKIEELAGTALLKKKKEEKTNFSTLDFTYLFNE